MGGYYCKCVGMCSVTFPVPALCAQCFLGKKILVFLSILYCGIVTTNTSDSITSWFRGEHTPVPITSKVSNTHLTGSYKTYLFRYQKFIHCSFSNVVIAAKYIKGFTQNWLFYHEQWGKRCGLLELQLINCVITLQLLSNVTLPPLCKLE